MAIAAVPMGVRIAVLDPLEGCPAATVVHKHVVGSFRDREAIIEFCQECDVVTVEIEHVDVPALEEVERMGIPVHPSSSTVKIIQDKYAQKEFFSGKGVPVSDFRAMTNDEEAKDAIEDFGLPLMLKSRFLAYDGRGNAVVKAKDQLAEAVAALGGFEHGLYAEKWAPFVKELAVMVVRSRDGHVVSYPVTETVHRDNICFTTETPARVPGRTAALARQVAEDAVAHLEGAGIFGVEMFLLEDGGVLLNEIAPRPHNSGHYTIEACSTSQFGAHVRAVLGAPLVSPEDVALRCGAAIMLNVLGEADGQEGEQIAHEILGRAIAQPETGIHWYEKAEVRTKRKMGHITTIGANHAVVQRRLKAIQSLEGAPGVEEGGEAPLVGIIMGSDSDLPSMKNAAIELEKFAIPFEVCVVSAHRTPDKMMQYARDAAGRGIKVIIAGAGGAAHLPGMTAAMTPLPVIGVACVPSTASYLNGVDALLSIVQMPRGVPVATVAIGAAANAGLLAARIIGTADPSVLEKVCVIHKARAWG